MVVIEPWQSRYIPTAARFDIFLKVCLIFCDLFLSFLAVCIVFVVWKPSLKTICRFAWATSKSLQNQPLFGTCFWKGSNVFKINLCDIAGCSEVLILREFLEGCDRIVGCSSCMLCCVQHSKIVRTFLLQLDHGKPKRKNCFRILHRRRIGFASASQGFYLMNSHFYIMHYDVLFVLNSHMQFFSMFHFSAG